MPIRTIARRALRLAAALAASHAVAAPPPLLIFGEQHDQPDQQRQVAAEVRRLAAAGQLAALVLEMAETPHGTSTLPRDADDARVRDALQWRGWPWEPYAEVVMSAVRAGVPVWGGNLPRRDMRAAMADATLDARVDEAARAALAEAVRVGHCGLLPATQEPSMVRIQIARDRSMAEVTAAALHRAPPGQRVLLLAGAQHASRDRGVPAHLLRDARLAPGDLQVVMFGDAAAGLQADEWRPAEHTPQPDPCAELKRSLDARGAASAAGAPVSAPR